MIRLSRSVLAVGGVVLAGTLVTVMNPKTVHAVAAALVQVTNTASNPVVTQTVGAQAENLVHLHCGAALSGTFATCIRYLPDQSFIPNFTIPAGESLVVTGVDLLQDSVGGCPGPYIVTLIGSGAQLGGFYLQLSAPNASITTHFTYRSGPVIGGGISPGWVGHTTQGCPNGEMTADVFGYLTGA